MAITPVLFPALSQFEEVRTVEKTPVIELSSSFPISILRSIVTVAGSGSTSSSAGEHLLSTTASGSDSVILDSAERGRYMPGYSAECGVGVRIPTMPVGSQNVLWGYTDGTDGVYFGVDATGTYVARLSGGVETKVYQTDWNVDKLDGTGASTLTLDLSRGNVFQILFTWYGYGVIEFEIIKVDVLGRQRKIIVHRMNVSGSNSIQEPNLPIRIKVSNGGTATAFSAYVGGRQFSIVGKYNPNQRTTAANRMNVAAIGSTVVPFLTLRKKSTFLDVPFRLQGIDIVTTSDALVQVYLASTLTGASFGSIPNTVESETCLELDTSATAMSGGHVIYSFFVGASGSGNSRTGSDGESGLSINLPESQTVTLAIRSLTGTITASGLMRMSEEW